MMVQRRWWPALAGLLLMLLLAACSDDAVTPPPGNRQPPAPFPDTPDSLVSLYRTALADMDSSLYQALLAPDFQYRFSPLDTAVNHLTTDYMTHAEALKSAFNIFGHVEVTNSRGLVVPPVERIRVFEFDLQDSWRDAPPGAPFPGTQVGRHFLRIHLERPFGLPTMSIIGDLEVYVRAVERIDNQGGVRVGYQLAGLVDPDTLAGKTEVYTWGMGFFTYLDNLPPVAVLQVRDTGTFPVPGFELNATGSMDVDSGLHPEAYRWRAAADSTWTTWRPGPLKRFTYADTGLVTVGVQVRDRWGLATEASAQVVVPAAALPFPDTPDQLLANLRTVFDNRVTGLVDDLLAPGHATYLDSTAAAGNPDLAGVLDRETELVALTNLLSGDDLVLSDDQVIPGVDYLSFTVLEKLEDWTTAAADDRVPGAQRATCTVSVFAHRKDGDDLQADSRVVFYATARDSLVEGVAQDYWQLAAQDDLGSAARELQPVSWSGLKAKYRDR